MGKTRGLFSLSSVIVMGLLPAVGSAVPAGRHPAAHYNPPHRNFVPRAPAPRVPFSPRPVQGHPPQRPVPQNFGRSFPTQPHIQRQPSTPVRLQPQTHWQPNRFPQQPNRFPQQPNRFPQQPNRFPQQPNRFPQQPNRFPQQPNRFPQRPNRFPQQPNRFPEHRPFPSGPISRPGTRGPIARPTHWERPVTLRNIGQGNHYAGRFQRAYPSIYQHVAHYAGNYHTREYPLISQRWNVYRTYFNIRSYRTYYGGLSRYGFFGGYAYPVRPCLDIHLFFTYPVLYWLYTDQPYDTFYSTYYGQGYQRYPVHSFPHVRAFFPTDTLRDLGMEISGMPITNQYNFRESLILSTNGLRDQIAQSIGQPFAFQPYSIVVNHYVNAGNQGIVIEGFVDSPAAGAGKPFRAFKAWLDLNNPAWTLTVAPAGLNMSQIERDTLLEINRRMQRFGINPNVAPTEPPPQIDNGQFVPNYDPVQLPGDNGGNEGPQFPTNPPPAGTGTPSYPQTYPGAPNGGSPQTYPGTNPPGGNPQYDPGTNPPGGNPQYDPGTNPPGGNPQYDPGTNPPGGNPQYDPRTNPPGGNPQYDPGTNPPGGNPQYDPGTNPPPDSGNNGPGSSATYTPPPLSAPSTPAGTQQQPPSGQSQPGTPSQPQTGNPPQGAPYTPQTPTYLPQPPSYPPSQRPRGDDEA